MFWAESDQVTLAQTQHRQRQILAVEANFLNLTTYHGFITWPFYSRKEKNKSLVHSIEWGSVG